ALEKVRDALAKEKAGLLEEKATLVDEKATLTAMGQKMAKEGSRVEKLDYKGVEDTPELLRKQAIVVNLALMKPEAYKRGLVRESEMKQELESSWADRIDEWVDQYVEVATLRSGYDKKLVDQKADYEAKLTVEKVGAAKALKALRVGYEKKLTDQKTGYEKQ